MKIKYLCIFYFLTFSQLVALENDFSRALFSRLGVFPADPRIADQVKQALLTGERSLTWSSIYADLYRFHDPDGSRAALAGLGSRFDLVCPWPEKKCVLSLQGNMAADHYDLAGSNRYVSADPRVQDNAMTGELYLPYFPAGIGVQLGGEYGRHSSTGRFLITRFPSAEQSDLNTYLFDLLEQTFGRTIEYDLDWWARGGTLKMEKGPFFLQCRYNDNSGRIAWTYTNTETTTLAGTKYTDFNLDASRLTARLGGVLPWRKVCQCTGIISYWQYRDNLDMLPRNPTQRSDGLDQDIRDWGGAEITQTGWSGHTGLDWAINPASRLTGALQLGYTTFNGSGTYKTPVLGYVYGPLLAIVHEFTGDLDGTIFSQYYHLAYDHWFGKKYSLAGRAGYLHSLIDARVDGQAGMEFNVATMPVDVDYEFVGHVFDGKIEGAARLAPDWKINVAIYQIVPIFRRTREERHAGPPPAPVAAKAQRITRGGTEYGLSVQYDF